MREVGCLDDESDDVFDAKAAVLAPAERPTGVRVSEDLLPEAEFLLGHVPEEPAEEWTGIVIGERLHKEVTREQVEHATRNRHTTYDQPRSLDEPWKQAIPVSWVGESAHRGGVVPEAGRWRGSVWRAVALFRSVSSTTG